MKRHSPDTEAAEPPLMACFHLSELSSGRSPSQQLLKPFTVHRPPASKNNPDGRSPVAFTTASPGSSRMPGELLGPQSGRAEASSVTGHQIFKVLRQGGLWSTSLVCSLQERRNSR